MQEKKIGLGELYMEGGWSWEQTDEMICRLLCGGLEAKLKGTLRYLVLSSCGRW
jgi:hypothetical protein